MIACEGVKHTLLCGSGLSCMITCEGVKHTLLCGSGLSCMIAPTGYTSRANYSKLILGCKICARYVKGYSIYVRKLASHG